MKAKKPERSTKVPALRRKAEKVLRATRRDVAAMPVEDVQHLVHELQVHQVELEMQNDELRRAQIELEVVRDRYVDLYDFSPAGHLTLDSTGTIVKANLRAGTLLGVARNLLIGQPLAGFIASEEEEMFRRHCREVLTTGTRQTCEVRLREEKGPTHWVYLESLAVFEAAGPTTHWRTALLDVSDRKRAERAQSRLSENLSRSDQHFQTLFNWTPSAVGISTLAEGRFCDVNEGFSRLTGYAREEVIGRTTLELGLWANPSERASVLREIQERGYLHNREGLLRTKSGEIRTIMVSVEPIQLGSIPCLIYLGHDITDRKRTEDELAERARLSAFSAEVSLSLNQDKPLHVLFQELTATIIAGLGCALARIWAIGPGDLCGHCYQADVCADRTACLHLIATAGLSTNLMGEFRRVPMGALKIGKIAQGAGAMTSNDVLHDERLPNKQWIRENGLQSFAGYPLVVEGRVFGVLALFGTQPFSALTLQTIASMCHGIATVISRKQTEDTLRNREHEFRLLADNVPAFYSYVDPALRYRFVNKRYEEFFDQPASDIAGKPVKDLVGERNFNLIAPYLQQALAGQEVSFTYPMELPHGDARWMNVQYTPDGDDTGRIKGVLILVTDVTSQKEAELALQQSRLVLQEKQEALHALTEKLLIAQDEERRRIARELHDDFNQRLAALAVELETLERAPIAPPEPIIRQLEIIRGHVGRLSDDLHDMAYKLHPSLLEHVGLAVAVRDHVAEFMQRTGLPVAFTARNVPDNLLLEVATNLFRVMQESLQNVAKHARATDITVRLSGSSRGLGLSVRDNGQGFDLAGKSVRAKGLGLMSMQERARGLGGLLRIHSLPGKGTKVHVWIPQHREEA